VTPEPPNRNPAFSTTRWSLVILAGDRDDSRCAEALSALCEAYWYPLYAFVRRQGHKAEDAADLTQGFFARFLERNDVAAARRERGRFRSYLLACMKHYLANEWDRARAQKRGGGRTPISIDAMRAEERYGLEPAYDITAEKLFDRRWALTLLDRVLGDLRREYDSKGKLRTFELLKPFLTAEGTPAQRRAAADGLRMTEGALNVALHRLRKRYRTLLRKHIADTVGEEKHVDEEIQDLFSALAVPV
jgi:DNA-directed RNA polymerase specialized sigma24 family protein